MVYDAVLDHEMTLEEYARWFNPVAERRYSQPEAAELGASTSHWGPWHPTTASFKER
jgi:hypothetical protein